MFTLNECPVCASRTLQPFLNTADHAVSQETFSLVKCRQCTLVMTTPRPEVNDLSRYYESPNYISHATRSASLFERIYRAVRHYNIDRKLNLILKQTRNASQELLDFGCGTGEFLQRAQQRGFSVAGVEPSDKAREHANKITGNRVTPSLKAEPDAHDVITLWHVLEHIPNLNDQFASLVITLRQTGTMFIAVPNHESDDAKRYRDYWAGYDVPRHLWHFNQNSMKTFLKKHGLIHRHTLPMKLDAFYVSMLSEQYIRGNNNISSKIYGLANGIQSNIRAARSGEYSSLIYIAEKK